MGRPADFTGANCSSAIVQRVILRPQIRQRGTRFGQPIDLRERAAQLLLRAPQQIQRHGRRAVSHHAQARRVIAVERRMVHHGVQHGRHHKHVRDPVALDGFQTRFGIERRHEATAAALHHQRVSHCPIRHVKHGSRVQPHPILVDTQRHHAVHAVRVEVLVGQHHALGTAGRAAGIEQRYDVVLIRERPVWRERRCGRQARFVIRHARGARAISGEQILQLRQAGAQCGRNTRKVIVHHQQARAGIRQAEADLRRIPSNVDRHNDRARQRHGVVQLEIAQRIQHQHRDAVARLHAQIAQRASGPRHAIGELRKRDQTLAIAGRDGIRVKLPGAPQRISHIHIYGLPSTITQATEPGPPRLCTRPSSASRTWRAPACPRNCVTTS
jgi:hypothetical protein